MKKAFIFITLLAMLSGMTACGNDTSDSLLESSSSNNVQTEVSTTENEESVVETEITESSETDSGLAAEPAKESSKILVCYFSFPETDSTDASSGASRVVIDGKLKGAMQYMAVFV